MSDDLVSLHGRPTVHDVARAAGVSIASVSRVLNGLPTRADTAARVRAAVARLDFRPSQIGRSLKTAETRTIGVLVPSLANPVFAETVAGVQAAMSERGYSVLLASSDYSPEAEAHGVGVLLAHQVAGLLLTVADADAAANPALERLDTAAIPYVLLFNQPRRPDRGAVAVDNAAAARLAVETLIAQGHRRLAMIAGRFRQSDRSRLRHQGFAAALAAAGLPVTAPVEIDFDQHRLIDHVSALMAGPEAPTGLFCSNDMIALGVIRALRALGRRVPDDVSVIGFDGIAVGELVEPSLASVIQPTHALGRAAAAQLFDRLAGQPPRLDLLPHGLRAGGSLDRAVARPADPIQRICSL